LLHTTGRESQVIAKVPDLGWRLVHVHYSGPAITGTGQGFWTHACAMILSMWRH
jgi:hypothetical protein